MNMRIENTFSDRFGRYKYGEYVIVLADGREASVVLEAPRWKGNLSTEEQDEALALIERTEEFPLVHVE